jgi:trk system potassium uptake protein TrkA
VKVGARAPVVNRRLRDLRSVQASAPFRIVGIARGERLIVPTDDTALAAEDHVYVVSRREVIPDILVLMGRTATTTRQVFVIGGGRIGLHVARALEAEEISVTVLERIRGRYEELTGELSRARVVHGDGTDVKLLVEEGIGSADAVATLTDDDPTNLLAGLLGKRHGAKKVVALFKRQDLIPLVGSLGIDAAISPRLLTASVILKYVRGGAVLSVFELPESEAETLEVVVQRETPAEGRSIEALGLGADALVGAVVRDDQTFTPDPDRVLAVGDHVILLALPRAIPAVERLFGL